MRNSVANPNISLVISKPLGHFYKSDKYKFRDKMKRGIKGVARLQD